MKKTPASYYAKSLKELEFKMLYLNVNFCSGRLFVCQILLKEIEDLSKKLRCELALIKTKEK